MEPDLKVADIGFVRSPSLLGGVIRRATRRRGEDPTEAQHVLGVIRGGRWHEAIIAEALGRVEAHGLVTAYGGRPAEVLIARPLNIPEYDRILIAGRVHSQVGRRYPKWHLIYQALDAVLGDRYIFRRLATQYGRKVCSALWAWGYMIDSSARRYGFGLPELAATPDDLLDFVRATLGEKWTIIREWAPVATAPSVPTPAIVVPSEAQAAQAPEPTRLGG